MFTNLLQSLVTRRTKREPRCRKPSKSRAVVGRRFEFEPLEDRTVPAAPVPVGAEFMVNTTTVGVQAIDRNQNSVASDAAGNHVVVWTGNGTQPGNIDIDGIFAQRYDSAGTAVGGETLVNTTTTGVQFRPVVARASAAGRYAVAWTTGNVTSVSSNGVFARVFNADGTAVTSQFAVATNSQKQNNSVGNYVMSIAMDASGDFAVLYGQTVKQNFFSNYFLYVQRYNAAGQAQGNAKKVVQVNRQQWTASLGMDANGNFVVAWDDYSSGWLIYAQRYSASGNAVGSRITVSAPAADYQGNTSVGMGANGDFVVAWVERPPMSTEHHAQSYTANGTLHGGPIEFGLIPSPEYAAGVAVETSGDFILVWEIDSDPAPFIINADIVAQRFNADGTAKAEGEFVVNTTLLGDQAAASVAVDATGDFVVVWNNPVPGAYTTTVTDCDVFAQRFQNLDSLTAAAPLAAESSATALPSAESTTAIPTSAAIGRSPSTVDAAFAVVGPSAPVANAVQPLASAPTAGPAAVARSQRYYSRPHAAPLLDSVFADLGQRPW